MVGQQILVLSIGVRIPVRQPEKPHGFVWLFSLTEHPSAVIISVTGGPAPFRPLGEMGWLFIPPPIAFVMRLFLHQFFPPENLPVVDA